MVDGPDFLPIDAQGTDWNLWGQARHLTSLPNPKILNIRPLQLPWEQKCCHGDVYTELFKRNKRAQSDGADCSKILILFWEIDHFDIQGSRWKGRILQQTEECAHFLFGVNVYTFLKNQECDCAEEGTRVWVRVVFAWMNVFCIVTFSRLSRVQNNMFTFRRQEQKTRKSKPGTFLIHSWAMRKFPFDFI